MSESRTAADVVIVGAGLVGSLAALLLTREAPELAITVIEPTPVSPLAADAPFDLRVSALTPATLALLARAGVDEALASVRQCRYTQMHVWDGDGTGQVHFTAREASLPFLGSLIENRQVQAVLTEALHRQPGIRWCCPQQVTGLLALRHGWRLTLADGESLVTPLVIAADGAQSPLRHLAGITTHDRDYGQHGLVCTVRTARPHDDTARQRFLARGPLAFLPLADPHQCSIVWTLPSAEAQALQAAPEATFLPALAQAIEHRLGDITAVGPRASYPLVARHAERYTLPGLALIGDAAHSIHPLAGQGVNLGFADAAALADALLAARRAGLPLAHPSALARYARRRRGENALMLHAMTGFERLFASQDPHVTVLRNAGLRLVDRVGALRQAFIRQAAGH